MSYVYGIVLIAFLAIGGWGFYQKSEAAGARGEAAQARMMQEAAEEATKVAVAANEAQAAAIEALQAQRAREEQILADIAHKLAVNNQLATEAARERADLEKTDATVRDYLATPIPGAYERVLNKGRAANGRSH